MMEEGEGGVDSNFPPKKNQPEEETAPPVDFPVANKLARQLDFDTVGGSAPPPARTQGVLPEHPQRPVVVHAKHPTLPPPPPPQAKQLMLQQQPLRALKPESPKARARPNVDGKDGTPKKPKQCNCKHTRCLKLYCECFALGVDCDGCNCVNCHNNVENEPAKRDAVEATLERNPDAFRPKIASSSYGNGDGREEAGGKHNKGCNCKNSECLRLYCECLRANIRCSENCLCMDCKNFEGSEELHAVFHRYLIDNMVYLKQMANAAIPGAIGTSGYGSLLVSNKRKGQEVLYGGHPIKDSVFHRVAQFHETNHVKEATPSSSWPSVPGARVTNNSPVGPSKFTYREIIAKTTGMTKNQNHNDDASSSSSSSRKMLKTSDNGGVVPWLDLNHDLLILVMMQLGVVDFLAFSGVCKSWRSFAHCNRNRFMVSKPPMAIGISKMDDEDHYWYLEDFEGRKFKPIHPHYAGRFLVGSTCGYLVLLGRETRDFWLVNPITRRELHFPNFPKYELVHLNSIRTILVFSPSTSEWVLVVKPTKQSLYIAGKQGWNHVCPTLDLLVFKGKIYTLHTDCTLCELRLNMEQKGKSTLLKVMDFSKPYLSGPQLVCSGEIVRSGEKLVSSGEKLYVINRGHILERDFGEMKWVLPEKTIEEYDFFISQLSDSVAIKSQSWGSCSIFPDSDKILQGLFYYGWSSWGWYFPHDYLKVNLLDES